jgi:hypothetical protein
LLSRGPWSSTGMNFALLDAPGLACTGARVGRTVRTGAEGAAGA